MHRIILSPIPAGILQGAGIVFYVFLVNIVIGFMAQRTVGDPFTILLLFCFSALSCAAIVLTYPLVLLTQKRIRDMVKVILSTIVTFALLLAGWILILIALAPSMPAW